MEVYATSEDVGAGETLERQLGTVCATTYGLHLRSHTTFLHGTKHQVNDVHLWVDLLFHVIVLILHLTGDRPFTVFLVHLLGALLNDTLAVLKAFTVMVADDVTHLRPLHVRLDAQQVIESLIALRRLWRLIGRQHRGELGCQCIGVHHLSLGIARMHAHTFYIYLGRGSVEVLELQFAHVAAVHRVGPFATELLHIEVVGAHADLLVGVEGDADGAVLHLLMLLQPHHRLHDLGNASLVVGSEERMAVSHNEVFAHMAQQFWELLGRHQKGITFLGTAQRDVRSVVIPDDPWLDVGPRAIGRRVVMRDEADGGHIVLRVCLQRGVDVSFLIEFHIAEALVFEFLLQVFCKYQLLGCTGHAAAVFGRLRVELGIVQKSLGNVHLCLFCSQYEFSVGNDDSACVLADSLS